MSLIDKLLSTDGIKKQLFSKMAKTAKENGFNQVLITIGENGEFNAEPLKNESVIITKTEHAYFLNLHNKSKL